MGIGYVARHLDPYGRPVGELPCWMGGPSPIGLPTLVVRLPDGTMAEVAWVGPVASDPPVLFRIGG
jgi:hypothetical protein